MSYSVLYEMSYWLNLPADKLSNRATVAKLFIEKFGDLAHLRAGAVGAEYYVLGDAEMFCIWKEITSCINMLMNEGWASGPKPH